MHTPAGYEYYWVVIPDVGLFVLLLNAYRMGKFRDLSAGSKIKGALVAVLAVVATLCLLNERVLDSYLVPSDSLSAYPNLEDAFLEQESGVPGKQIVIVEFGNLFWSHEVYLLPCYRASTLDVPQNGQAHWNTEVWILGTGEEKLSLRNLELNMDFGAETMLSSRVELNGGEALFDMGADHRVLWDQEFVFAEEERFRVGVLASTSVMAELENMETQGGFVWNYDLYYDGVKVAEIRDDVVSGTYLVNAT